MIMELLCRSLLCWLYHWVGASHQNLKMDLFEHSIPQTASQAYHGSKTSNTTGWWFGTCFIFPYIGNSNPNWLLFFRGVETAKQGITTVIIILNVIILEVEHKEDKTLKPYKTKNNEDTNGINMKGICRILVLIGICFGGRPWEHNGTHHMPE